MLSVNGTQSVTASGGTVTLVNDTPTLGSQFYYGSNDLGVRGWFPITGSLAPLVAATGAAAVAYTDARVAATGQVLVGLVYGGDDNLSGALVSMSGQLVTQIQSAAGVLSLNNATGLLTLTSAPSPASYIGVSTSGTTLYISGISTPNGALQLVTHTTSGGGLGLGPDNSIWRTGPNQIVTNSSLTMSGGLTMTGTLVVSAQGTQIRGSDGAFIGVSRVVAGSTSDHSWLNRSIMRSPADGRVTFLNQAETAGAQLEAANGIFSSGIFFQNTGNYTLSGVASIAQLFGLSGGLLAYIGAGGAPNVVYTTGSQTINGTKTFLGPIVMGAASIANQSLGNFYSSGRMTLGVASPANLTKLQIGRDSPSAQTTTAPSGIAYYLGIGAAEFGTGVYRLIGFGYRESGTANYPGYFGFQERTTAGQTFGDFVFGTRSVSTDTTPTERMRIMGPGNIGMGTADPQERLHISGGNLRVDGSGFFLGSLFLTNTGNYTPSGVASVAQLLTLSGNSRAFATAVATGLDFIPVSWSPPFPGLPSIAPSLLTSGTVGYMVWPSGITTSGYNAMFSATTANFMTLNTIAIYRA